MKMKPVIETGYRNYRVVSWIPARFGINNNQLDSPFMVGYVMANSPKEAFEIKKRQGKKVYGVTNKIGEYIYPPKLVDQIEKNRRNSENIPF
jgi:hypothetical protein